ncbi:uncharacterized protein LOC143033813 [Oratosquilla oratoria]|uniref:uncharacterized protein LOC143033813 n=1 Tax=Oratosquilla oratoria TaxID=337810 RepID=UPI003F767B7E
MDTHQRAVHDNVNTSFTLTTQERCVNWTSALVSVIQHVLKGSVHINKEDIEDDPGTKPLPHNNSSTREEEDDLYAFIYIIFVLLFFASSLVVLLIRYLRTEKETLKIQKFYDQYMTAQPPRYILRDAWGCQLTWNISEGCFLRGHPIQTTEEKHNHVLLGTSVDDTLQQLNSNTEIRVNPIGGETSGITSDHCTVQNFFVNN